MPAGAGLGCTGRYVCLAGSWGAKTPGKGAPPPPADVPRENQYLARDRLPDWQVECSASFVKARGPDLHELLSNCPFVLAS